MKLLTKALTEKLLANGRLNAAHVEEDGNTEDLEPVVKFFNPCGAATWLITEMDEDEDRMFGLCDLGFGTPELGYVSLSELASVKCGFGLGIERDIWFEAEKTLAEYAAEARETGRIAA